MIALVVVGFDIVSFDYLCVPSRVTCHGTCQCTGSDGPGPGPRAPLKSSDGGSTPFKFLQPSSSSLVRVKDEGK